jgi:hypothetical protein
MYDRPPGLSPAWPRIAHRDKLSNIGWSRNMETVPLELPAGLVKLAQFVTESLSHKTAKVLALDLFRERKFPSAAPRNFAKRPLPPL